MQTNTVEKGMLLTLVAIVLSFATIAPGLGQTVAAANSDDEVLKNLPKKLTDKELEKAKKIVLEDIKVKELTSGKNKVDYSSQNFISYAENPDVWYPEVRFYTDNQTQIVAVVDMENNRVKEAKSFVVDVSDDIAEMQQTGYQQRTFAVDAYTGSSTIIGLGMQVTAPSFTPNSARSPTAFLVNAVMQGSAEGAPLCTFSQGWNNYWAQAGFGFSPTSGGYVSWTDSFKNCVPQPTNVPYSTNNLYTFRVYTDAAHSQWVIYLKNQSTGTTSTVLVGGPPNYTIKKNTTNTSIFMENWNTNTLWDSQFGGDITNVYKQRLNQGTSTWTNSWNGNAQVEMKCGQQYTPDTVISPSSSNPATWDVSEFADNWPVPASC